MADAARPVDGCDVGHGDVVTWGAACRGLKEQRLPRYGCRRRRAGDSDAFRH
jgi:hypothetical protein